MCSFLVWKNACLNYREFGPEGDLVGVPNTWYLSAQSFIRRLKLVWREYAIVAMNEWKKKCVGLQRTWVSKRTVCRHWLKYISLNSKQYISTYCFCLYQPFYKFERQLSRHVTHPPPPHTLHRGERKKAHYKIVLKIRTAKYVSKRYYRTTSVLPSV